MVVVSCSCVGPALAGASGCAVLDVGACPQPGPKSRVPADSANASVFQEGEGTSRDHSRIRRLEARYHATWLSLVRTSCLAVPVISSTWLGLSLLLAAGLPNPRIELGPEAGYAGGGADQLVSVTEDALGRRVAAGWSFGPDGRAHALVLRWSREGELDPSFGSVGVVLLPNEGAISSRRLFGVTTAGRKIIVVGEEGDGRTSLGFVTALEESGVEDRSFRERVLASLPERPLLGAAWLRSRPLEVFRGVLADDQGRIIVAGTSSDVRISWRGLSRLHRGVLFRLRPGGELDSSFGADGLSFVGGAQPASLRGRDEVLRVRSDVRGLAVVGWSEGPEVNAERGFVARFDVDGHVRSADTSRGLCLGPARSAIGGVKEVFYDLVSHDDRTLLFGFAFSSDERQIRPSLRTFDESRSGTACFDHEHTSVISNEAIDASMALGIAVRMDAEGRRYLVGYTQDSRDHTRDGDRGFLVVQSSTSATFASYLTRNDELPGVELHDLLLADAEVIAVGRAGGRSLVLSFTLPPRTRPRHRP